MRSPTAVFALASLLTGCATAPPPVTTTPAPVPPPVGAAAVTTSAAGGPPAPAPPTMPTTCVAGSTGACTPPGAFVDALCGGGNYLEAALALFEKGTPWSRTYLRGDVDAWYASGGGSARARLAFDEEMLVLRVRAAPTTGVVVGNGAASYDVLRWDGLCYTLDEGELTTKHPPRAKHPPLPFHHLSDAAQAALLKDDKVHAAYAKRGKECHGVTTGDVTLACERADRALGEAVIEFVGAGGALPPPVHIPGG